MKLEIEKSGVLGKIKAPPSKSYTHRALILAALAKGKSKIFNPLICDDTMATIDCLRKIGIEIKRKKDFLEIKGGNFSQPKEILFCRESGTTLRLMTGVCALIRGKSILTGERSLMERPIQPLLEALKNLGVKSSLKENSIIIEDNFIGGKTRLRGDISSQFISSLLLISPFAERGVEIELKSELESRPYVLMTIEAQKKFGVKIDYSKDLRRFFIKKQKYQPRNYFVEGDWSSAAPFLAAGAISGRVEVKNLNLKSLQADRKIIRVLKKFGAKVIIKRDSVLTEKSGLRPIKFNVQNCPDLFPIVSILAALAKGKSEISGIERLKFKESDRLEEMKRGLEKMGIKSYLKGKKFFIEGGEPKGGMIETNDHRIVMAFSILGLRAKGKTIIKNPQSVSKSFPQFFEILEKLRRKTKSG